jgi:hypothetical protein
VRRLATFSMLAVAVPAVVVLLPVATIPQASPRPVSATTQHIDVPFARNVLATASAGQPLELVTQRSTSGFRALGLSWRRDAAVNALRAEVRVHTAGTWTPWQELDSSDLGPDAGTDGAAGDLGPGDAPRDGTDPMWVDHADGVEARLLSVTGAQPRDLRIDLIDPGSSPADATVGSTPHAQSARADMQQPPILTRTDWGADESLRQGACPSGPEYTGSPKVAFVHHTVTANSYAPDDVPAIIRSIYAFHVQGEGWCDVGYNFLVDRFGRIWEGRFGGIDKAVLGAHTGGFNTDSFGVSLIGTFTAATPPQPMVDALAQVIAWKLAMSYANPLGTATMTAAPFDQVRYAPGTKVSLNVISGHRDADLTSCPGNAAYALLPGIRQEVLQDMGAGLVNPTRAVPVPRTVAGNGTVHVVAGMLFPGDWQLLVQDANGATVRTLSGAGSSIDTTWDMTSDAGTPVPAGQYTITLTSNQNGQVARPWTSSVLVGGVFGSFESVGSSIGQISVKGWAARGADTNPAQLTLTVDGNAASSMTPSVSRPDVAAVYPQYGANRGYTGTTSATPGYHYVCVIGSNSDLGIPDTKLGCAAVNVPAPVVGRAVPTGHLEIAWPAVGAVQVGGWALDADTPDPVTVHVYVDGIFHGAFTASGNRPDVGAAFPGMGDAHGFGAVVGTFYGGDHQVCVYAINVGGGVNPQLGCAKVTLPGGNPRGSLNIAQGAPGAVRVVGWALDPDSAGPISTHVYVDGHWAGATVANLARPDVGAAFPGYGAGHGFDVTVAVVGGGTHQVCTYAINVGQGTTNPRFACATVTMPTGKPRGSLDVVTGRAGGARVAGWSLDPDTTGPVQVHLYVDGRWTAALTADSPRLDVAAAFAGYGAGHGYDTVLPLPAGKHTVCAYAINVGPAAPNPLLGCKAVTTSAG